MKETVKKFFGSRRISRADMRGGFTIVELLVVIAVMGVLMGIVTTAATASIRQARGRRIEAMKQTLQSGIAAYYAKNDEWPKALENVSKNATFSKSEMESGCKVLSDKEAEDVFKELIKESTKSGATPYLDVNGLFVAKDAPASGPEESREKVARGRDFKSAANRNDKRSYIPVDDMIVGYPRKKSGYFRRYRIYYNFRTDSVSVHAQAADE